jgi:hypothetical protein
MLRFGDGQAACSERSLPVPRLSLSVAAIFQARSMIALAAMTRADAGAFLSFITVAKRFETP